MTFCAAAGSISAVIMNENVTVLNNTVYALYTDYSDIPAGPSARRARLNLGKTSVCTLHISESWAAVALAPAHLDQHVDICRHVPISALPWARGRVGGAGGMIRRGPERAARTSISIAPTQLRLRSK